MSQKIRDIVVMTGAIYLLLFVCGLGLLALHALGELMDRSLVVTVLSYTAAGAFALVVFATYHAAETATYTQPGEPANVNPSNPSA